MGDLFKRSAISGEWTFVAGSTASYAGSTVDQGVGVPIAGNFSGPGSRAQPSWSVRRHSRSRGDAALQLEMRTCWKGSASPKEKNHSSLTCCFCFCFFLLSVWRPVPPRPSCRL